MPFWLSRLFSPLHVFTWKTERSFSDLPKALYLARVFLIDKAARCVSLHASRRTKCSGEIDLKFGAVCAERVANLAIDGLLRSGDEVSPVVFGLLPDDLDEGEFGTVWWQIEQLHAMLA